MELQKVIDEGIEEIMQNEITPRSLKWFAAKIIKAIETPVCPHFINIDKQKSCKICQK